MLDVGGVLWYIWVCAMTEAHISDRISAIGGFGQVSLDLIKRVRAKIREEEQKRDKGIDGHLVSGLFELRQDPELGIVITLSVLGYNQIYMDGVARDFFDPLIEEFKSSHDGSIG